MEINDRNYKTCYTLAKLDENKWLAKLLKQEKNIADFLEEYAMKYKKGETRDCEYNDRGNLVANLAYKVLEYEQIRAEWEGFKEKREMLESLTENEENE